MQARHGRTHGPLWTILVAVAVGLPLLMPALPGALPAAPVMAADASPVVGGWQPVDVPTVDDAVTLTAAGDGPNGLPLQPELTLRRTDGGSPDELLAGFASTPAATFEPVPGTDRDTLVVRPTEPLRRATEYRFTVRTSGGGLLGSWVFVTQGPPHVTGFLPEEYSSRVPVTTGIEITFDQPNVGDLAPYFTIMPAVTGRFETHDRTIVFVPDRPLQPGTEYEVGLRAGVPVTTTGERLESAWSTGFTTASEGKRIRRIGSFPRAVTEASTVDAAIIPFDLARARLTTVPVQVHRLPDLPAALAAVRTAQAMSERWDARLDLDPSGLELVLAFDAALPRTNPWDSSGRALTLPAPLPAGWYVVSVTDAAGDARIVLQVTDLAVYSHITTTRSAVWVNDVATGTPVRGAGVRLVGGGRLGATDADGLLVAETPAALLAADPKPLFVVREGTRTTLVPFGTSGWEAGDVMPDPDSDGTWMARSELWTLLYTDRERYRTTDAVNVWGLVRDRDTDAVPDSVVLELRSIDGDGASTPIERIAVMPSSLGGYVATLPLDDVPTGGYVVALLVDDVLIDETWFEVAVIAKPAYRLSLEPARRIYIEGETIPLTVGATFFDGTAVPGVPVLVRGSGGSVKTSTDGRGTADARLTARIDEYDDSQWSVVDVTARPGRGEEGSGDATTQAVVFRSAVVLTADATIIGGEARLSGTVAQVDRARLERQYDRAYELAFDPRGAPVAGADVRLQVIEETPFRRQDGTTYDYVLKRVVPVWEYRTRTETIRTATVTTDAAGRYTLRFPVTRGHGYRVAQATVDSAGRRTMLEVYAQRPSGGMDHYGAYLTSEDSTLDWWYPHGSYRIGERFTVQMRSGQDLQPRGGDNRYLWLSSQRGLRSASVDGSPTHAWTFHAADAPMLEISAVRFTGDTYIAAPDSFAADIDPAQRELRVTITPVQKRYAPGETAAIDVRVQDARGRPVVADVALRAIDEKLYAIGAAADQDPLTDLYRSVDTGTRWTYASHQLPRGAHSGEGGDSGTEGGQGRDDFRDQLLFSLARTDADGRVRVTFDLSDDLTSWRVTGTALTDRLQVGQASTLVPVGLPFFVDIVTAPEYLVADQAAIRVRAYGRGLAEGDAVTLEVSAPSLGMAPVSIATTAFTEVAVPLPALTAGVHAITVAGSGTGRTSDLSDRLTRTIRVVPSRLSSARTAWTVLDEPIRPSGGDGINSFSVIDAGRGAALPVLLSLVGDSGPRADQAIAAAEARRLLIERFGMDPASLPETLLDRSQYQARSGGITVLPYAKADAELSALVALAAPESVDRQALGDWLDELRSQTANRSGRGADHAMALAGLAALGRPVVTMIRARAALGPTDTKELSWLAVAAAEAGDRDTARSLQAEVLEQRGEQQQPYLRVLSSGGTPDGVQTGLMAITAARLGQLDIMDAADRYLEDHPPAATVTALERLAGATRRMDAVPAAAARFAATIDGTRTEITLEPGRTWSVALIPAQLAGFTLEPIEGSLGLAASWLEPLTAAEVGDDPTITVTRRVEPRGPVEAGAIVTVRIRVGLTSAALDGCYLVTDLAPSGLAPVTDERQWRDRDGILPWQVDGQRVTFCVSPDPLEPVQVLRYAARVITPGIYAWEPTLVQSMSAPDVRELGRPGSIELR